MADTITRQALDQRNMSMVARGIDLFEDPILISEHLRQERIRKSLQRPRPRPMPKSTRVWVVSTDGTRRQLPIDDWQHTVKFEPLFDALWTGEGRRHA